MNTPNSLGMRLKIARETLGGVNQAQIGAAVGLHKNTIYKYENDIRKPNSEMLNRLCEALRVSHEWLMTGVGVMRPDDAVSPIPSNREAVHNRDNLRHDHAPGSPLANNAKNEESQSLMSNEFRLFWDAWQKTLEENKRLYREKEVLMEENAELKVQVARLEEQLKVAQGGEYPAKPSIVNGGETRAAS